MKTADPMAILQQLFVADRKQRTPQRCKYRQLVFRPLDGGQRGAQGLDLRAIMKRAAAHQQMGNPARFERLDVGPRHVFLEANEPAEQQADMARLNRHEVLRLAGPKAPRRSRRQRRIHRRIDAYFPLWKSLPELAEGGSRWISLPKQRDLPPAVRRLSSRFH